MKPFGDSIGDRLTQYLRMCIEKNINHEAFERAYEQSYIRIAGRLYQRFPSYLKDPLWFDIYKRTKK